MSFYFFWEWPWTLGTPSAAMVSAFASLMAAMSLPLVAIVLASFFGKPIRGFIDRMTHAEGFGIKLRSDIDSLKKRVDQIQDDDVISGKVHDSRDSHVEGEESIVGSEEMGRDEMPGTTPVDRDDDTSTQEYELFREYSIKKNEIIETMAISPNAALMLVSSNIESGLRLLVEPYANDLGRNRSIPSIINFLTDRGVIDNLFRSTLIDFRSVRNLVVHGEGVSDTEVRRSVDIGLTIFDNISRLLYEHIINRQVRSIFKAIDQNGNG